MRLSKNKTREYLFIYCLLMAVFFLCLSAIGLYIIGILGYGIFFGFMSIIYLILGIDFENKFRRNKPES